MEGQRETSPAIVLTFYVAAGAFALAIGLSIGVIVLTDRLRLDERSIQAAAISTAIAELRADVDERVLGASLARPRGTSALAIDLLARRTQWLHEVMRATCTRDGFGRREDLPDPPPGWDPIPAAELSGPWEAPR